MDNKISNANALLVDDSLEPSEKVARAIKSFKRISESEIFTHRKITELMVEQVLAEIDFTDFNNNPKIVYWYCKQIRNLSSGAFW